MSDKSFDKWVDDCIDRCTECEFYKEGRCLMALKDITEIAQCGFNDVKQEQERGQK